MFVSSTKWMTLCFLLFTGVATADTNYNPIPNITNPIICSADETRHYISITNGTQSLQLIDLVPGTSYYVFLDLAVVPANCQPKLQFDQHTKVTTTEPGVWKITTNEKQVTIDLIQENCENEQWLTLSIGPASTPIVNHSTSFLQGISANYFTYSVQELVEEVFIGGDCFNVESGSISYSGEEISLGYFSGGDGAINIEEGIILSTGAVGAAQGPNERYNTGSYTSGYDPDDDLSDLLDSNYPIRDRASLEFDFTPTSDMISFEFVFASEEYCEYVNSNFNDVFGFFVSGPGINGPFSNNAVNLAIVPGTSDFISINTINHFQNTTFFNNNVPEAQHDDMPNALSCPDLENEEGVSINTLEYDGFTEVLTASTAVIPCETYHIKLAISDVQDSYFDSAVFLKANSFNAGGSALVSPEVPGFDDNILTEQCTEGYFNFTRTNDDLTEPLVIHYTISNLSTAVSGIDYEALPDSIIIPAGDSVYAMPILVYEDGITEGMESIVLELDAPCSCEIPYSVIEIQDGIPMTASDISTTICEGADMTLTSMVTGGIGNLTYQWSTDAITPTINISADQNAVFTVTVTDQCGNTAVANQNISITEQPTATISGSSILCNTIPTSTIQVDFTGEGPWDIQYTVNGVPQNSIPGILNNPYALPVSVAGTYELQTVGTAGCFGNVNGIGTVNSITLAAISEAAPLTCPGAADGSLTVTPIGGLAPYDFAWSNNQNTPIINDLDMGLYVLTITDQNGCQFTDNLVVPLDPQMPVLDIAVADTLTCAETEISLSATASSGSLYAHVWETTNGNITNGATTLNPAISQPGTYTLAVTNINSGCRRMDTVLVNQDIVAPQPEILITGPSTLTCSQTSTVLDATTSQPAGLIDFGWTTTNGLLSPVDINNPIPEIDSAGIYQLLVTNTYNGCTATTTTTIGLDVTLPIINIVPPGDLTCRDTRIQLDATASDNTPEFSIQWETTNGNILNGATNLDPEINEPGTYILTITNTVNGCPAVAQIAVSENVVPPSAEAGSTAENLDCDTPELILDANLSSQGNRFFYNWSTVDGQLMAGMETLTPMINQPGTYTLTVTDEVNGCTATDNLVAIRDTVAPMIGISIDGTAVLTCAEPSTALNALTSLPVNDRQFFWTTTDGEILLNEINNPVTTITTPGTYQVMVTNIINACTSEETVFIPEDKVLPNVVIAEPAIFDCRIDTLLLDASGSDAGFNYVNLWTTTGGLLIGGETTLNPRLMAQGNYNLEITNIRNGCVANDAVFVFEDRVLPLAAINPATEMLDCNTPELSLSAVGATTGGTLVYQWNTSDGQIINGVDQTAITVTAAGIYEMMVTNTENGCIAITTTPVLANENRPTAAAIAVTDPLCYGESGAVAVTEITGGEGPFTYTLDVFESYYTDTLYENLSSGNYVLSVLDLNGCLYEQEVTIPFVPPVIVETEPVIYIKLGETVKLSAVSNIPDFRIDKLIWDPWVDTLCVNCFNPEVRPFDNTSYTITVVDVNGCVAEARTQVIVDKTRHVFIPNAFSPNNDGANDRLTVFADAVMVKQVNRFQIFNRWGEKVFERRNFNPNDERFGWDGFFKGSLLNNGVFVYHVEVEFVDGVKQTYEGDATLIK